MFNLKDCGQFALSVAGTDLQLGVDNVKTCTVIEDFKSITPSVNVEFVDTRQFSQWLGLFQDGAPLQLTIGDGKGSNPLQYNFLQWSLDNGIINAAGASATLNGIANVMPWVSKIVNQAYKGNASDVLRQLAGQAGFPLTDIDSTQDHQTWLPDGRALGQFARNMIDNSWMGSGATPHMAVTSQAGQWMVRLKNIMTAGSAGNSFISMGLPGAGTSGIPIWTYQIDTKGGPLNTYSDYGFTIVQEMLSGKANIFSNFSFSGLSSLSGISSAISGAIGTARSYTHRHDAGNSHPNYAQALHSNRMGRSTFSVFVTILTDQVSNTKLLDDMSVQLVNTDGSVNQSYSGTYKVTNISRNITRGNYMEKIIGAAQGFGAS